MLGTLFMEQYERGASQVRGANVLLTLLRLRGGGGSWSEPQEAVSGLLSNRKALNGQHTGLVSRAKQSKWLYKVQV